MSDLNVAAAIRQLRRDLSQAIEEGRGEALQFALGPVEVELEVALKSSAGASAEAKWVVVSFGAEAGGERTRQHRIRFQLTPRLHGREDVVIRDDTGRDAARG